MLSMPMPFAAVPCHVWVAREGEPDAYGNGTVSYADEPDYVTRCLYAPSSGSSGDASTTDDIDEGRPRGDRQVLTFYLPKDFAPTESLRDALIAALPPSDPHLAARRFKVVGDPVSYPRENTPGDYSWVVRGVVHLG